MVKDGDRIVKDGDRIRYLGSDATDAQFIAEIPVDAKGVVTGVCKGYCAFVMFDNYRPEVMPVAELGFPLYFDEFESWPKRI